MLTVVFIALILGQSNSNPIHACRFDKEQVHVGGCLTLIVDNSSSKSVAGLRLEMEGQFVDLASVATPLATVDRTYVLLWLSGNREIVSKEPLRVKCVPLFSDLGTRRLKLWYGDQLLYEGFIEVLPLKEEEKDSLDLLYPTITRSALDKTAACWQFAFAASWDKLAGLDLDTLGALERSVERVKRHPDWRETAEMVVAYRGLQQNIKSETRRLGENVLGARVQASGALLSIAKRMESSKIPLGTNSSFSQALADKGSLLLRHVREGRFGIRFEGLEPTLTSTSAPAR